MNITPIISAYGSQIQGVQDAKSAKAENKKPAAPRSENVQLSDTSRSLQSVQDAVKKVPEMRVDLVVELKRKIGGGLYDLENSLDKALENMMRGKVV